MEMRKAANIAKDGTILKDWWLDKYVSYDKNRQMTLCLVETCHKQFRGRRTSNIIRHFRMMHKNIYISCLDGKRKSSCINPILRKPVTKSRKDLKHDEFIRCCIGMVTVKNIPMRIFDDAEFFKRLIEPYEAKFETNLNSSNMEYKVQEASEALKQTISNNISSRPVSLKIDVASRMGVHALLVNVQHMKDYKIQLHSLGVIEILEHQTALALQQEIWKCLADCGVQKNQLFSHMIDNNVKNIKVMEMMQEMSAENISWSPVSIESPVVVLQSIVEELMDSFLKEITECRNAIKNLIKFYMLDEIDNTPPSLDNPIDWKSTYNMIKYLHTHRSNVDEMGLISRIYVDWKFVVDFVQSFKPIYDFVLKIEADNYLLGDFFRDCMGCELELSELLKKTPYATSLYNAVISIKMQMLEQDVFIAALFLDPRFNFNNTPLLSPHHKQSAVKYLLDTYHLIFGSEPKEPADTKVLAGSMPPYDSTDMDMASTSQSTMDKLTQHIRNLTRSSLSVSQSGYNMRQMLSTLCERQMESMDTDVLLYWRTQCQHDELNIVAQVIFAVAAGQASTQRAASALTTLITKSKSTRRYTKSLADILLIKLNFDMMTYPTVETQTIIKME